MWQWLQRILPWRSSSPLPMPIIVGAPRSGTTLLRFMLDAHPQMAIPPETGFLVSLATASNSAPLSLEAMMQCITQTPADSPTWPDFQLSREALEAELRGLRPFNTPEAVRSFYRLYAQRLGKPRYGDKTPAYCHSLPAIERLLPEAAFVHLIRDGRDVALSLRPLWFAPSKEIGQLAERWRQDVSTAQRDGANCQRYLEVRYEDLIQQPEATLRTICDFLQLTFHPQMLRYYETTPQRLQEHGAKSNAQGEVWLTKEQRQAQQQRTTQPPDLTRVGAWKANMTAEEQTQFAAVAGELLQKLGYA